jgi:hypothetical protein|tara:strand:- start:424 stop:891 length:468 start_codon:yes stop_codon:yes gene_type:complete
MDLDYSKIDDDPRFSLSRPQEGRSGVVRASLDALNDVEYSKMNRILEQEYDKKKLTILDKPLGDVLEGTVNFVSNSYNSYADKFLEAKFSKLLFQTDNEYLNGLQIHLIAISLFIRDDENVIYLGIIMVIISFLLCFINITRANEFRLPESVAKP